MKWMGLNDIREKFLSFFESKDHLRLKSYSLVPVNDKSLLLINSGMAPMKKYFTGEVTPPSPKVATCQKCIRTPDIENVGKTSRHGTFFEMLGNFSFQNYFKVEAIHWAWEFMTEVMEIPQELLYVSVYQDDDEAYDIWTKQVKVSPSNMVRLGKADNFWEHGSGPCGPCSEIYFDRGEKHGCGDPNCAPGCECDRYVEVWNLVFTQFDSDGKGNYPPLAKPNIDTGMGLERLAVVMQGVNNLFEVDTVQNIMAHVARLANIKYGDDEKKDISLRVITDHIRSTVFMISDGVLPSNEGRGYVLRRLLRRAARHGRLLGINKDFLYEVCQTVIEENLLAYPELKDRESYIIKTIQAEEQRFGRTIDKGMEMLNNFIRKISSFDKKILSGEVAFELYDTHGFPIDLTKEIISEHFIDLEQDVFDRLMNEQRQKAQEARKKISGTSWASDSANISSDPTKFVGYDDLESSSVIKEMIVDGQLVGAVDSGTECVIILDKTPFYAESGGQVGDSGQLIGKDGSVIIIKDCKKTQTGQYLHVGTVEKGTFVSGDSVVSKVCKGRRDSIKRNHTSAHLIQAALREVLGDHILQAGSYVDDKRVRFDFSHFSAMTDDELKKVEKLVNSKILEAIAVDVKEMALDDAKKEGAIALFDEKYGDVVRIVKIGDFSTEFCGGTHVSNTSHIGLFRIVSENSVAAGVRRIEGTTGWGILELLDSTEKTIFSGAKKLKLQNPMEIVDKIKSVITELKDKDREIQNLNQQIAKNMIDNLLNDENYINGIRFISAVFKGGNVNTLKMASENLRDSVPNAVVLFFATQDDKCVIISSCGKEAIQKGAHAGNIIKEVAKIGGGFGGGRPDSAMGGIKDIYKTDEAMHGASDIIANMIKS